VAVAVVRPGVPNLGEYQQVVGMTPRRGEQRHRPPQALAAVVVGKAPSLSVITVRCDTCPGIAVWVTGGSLPEVVAGGRRRAAGRCAVRPVFRQLGQLFVPRSRSMVPVDVKRW